MGKAAGEDGSRAHGAREQLRESFHSRSSLFAKTARFSRASYFLS
jgi:hypothetical protein